MSLLTPEARASIATYGLRERVLEVAEIEDLERARSYAIGYFNRYAVPQRQGRLSLEPCDVRMRFVGSDPDATPEGQVAVSGAKVPIPDQNPARIEYSLGRNGALRCDIDLTQRRPDPALLLKRALSGGGRGGGGGRVGAGTNLRPSPGNSVPGGDEGDAPTWQVNDADVGARSRLDLVAGTALQLVATDDEANDRVRVVASVTLGTGAGQAAAGNHSHSLAGDVAGQVGATVVERIQGKPVPAPGAGQNGLYVRYNHANGEFEYGTPPTASGGSSAAPVQAWRRNGIQNSGTSKDEMPGLEGIRTGITVHQSGRVAGISLDVDAVIGGSAADWYEVELYRNGAATGLTLRIQGNHATTGSSAAGSVAFAAGDKLTVYDQRSGMGSVGRSTKATLFLQFD